MDDEGVEDKEHIPHTQHVQLGCDTEWLDRRVLDPHRQSRGRSAGSEAWHGQ